MSGNAGLTASRFADSAVPHLAVQPRRRRPVLMFAYYFPPLGASGVQRTVKFVKYLPEHGYAPLLVTGKPRWLRQVYDESLLPDIPPETVVVQAPTLPLDLVQGKLDGLLRRLGVESRFVRSALWPDELLGWIPAAVRHGLRLVREHRPEVIFSTSLPVIDHLAALIVHRLTGLPWVADFRDAWTLDPGPHGGAYGPPLRLKEAFERRVIAHASTMTVACPSVRLVGLQDTDPRRVVIPNGVDPDDLATVTREQYGGGDTFTLAHVGTLYGSRDAAPVMSAIDALRTAGRITADDFVLRIVGRAHTSVTGIAPIPVEFSGFVDHPAALAEMADATALLFYQPPQQLGSSGKIYEYLASGRPILCVGHPDNVAYKLVQELGAGECADARDVGHVTAALGRLVDRWRRGDLRSDPDVRDEALRRFSRRKLAGDLASVLAAATAAPRLPLGTVA